MFMTLFFLLTSTVQATSWEQGHQLIKSLRESPLGLELGLDNQLTKDHKNSVNGLSQEIALNFNYELVNGQEIALNMESSYEKISGEKGSGNFEMVEIGYGSAIVLPMINKKISTGLFYQYPLNRQTREEDKQNGSISLELGSKFKLRPQLFLSGKIQLSQYLNTSGHDDITAREVEFKLSPKYSFSDALSMKLPIKSYFKFNKKSQGDGFNKIKMVPTISHEFKSGFGLELYAELVPFKSFDGELMADDYLNKATYGVSLAYELF